jgi:hypothetical protein
MDVPASLLDLSERGAKVRATVPLRLGQDVEVKVGSQDAEARNYRVVWVRGDPMARQPAYDAGLKLCR